MAYSTLLTLENLQYEQGGQTLTPESEMVSTSEEDVIADLMKHHDEFVGSMHSRLIKLQVIGTFSF